jgi:Ca2+/Na+ antiporter
MIIVWILASAILAFFSILLHTLVARWLDPEVPGRSMKRFRRLFVIRLMVISLFFLQLVQQDVVTLITCVIVFLAVYAGSLYFIISHKSQWFQPEQRKEVPAWKL